MILIKGGKVFSPDELGVKDILVSEGKIIKIDDNICCENWGIQIETIDASEKFVVPGYIDQHVHLIGGGGEAGFYSRTPEVLISKVVESGITTVIGVLGTDGTTRHLESLLAKTKALDTEGITAYMLTGSYEIPVINMTGDIRRDVILIDKVLGVGEIAVSDHRSSQSAKWELEKIMTQSRVGGMLSGKAGVTQFHLGEGERMLSLIFEIAEETEIPLKHFIPTHVNRTGELLEEAIRLAKLGAYVDITSGITPEIGFTKAVKPSAAIKKCLDNGVHIGRITMSSDGNGSMAVYNRDGQVEKLMVTSLNSLNREFKDAVLNEKVDMSDALRIITENPAKANGLYPAKGTIKIGSDADITILTDELNIDSVVAKGKKVVCSGKAVIQGTFEE